MCSQIAVAVAVDGLPTHAATDLFNLSQFSDSNNVGPRLWWPNLPPNIREFWSTATATAICKSWWWLRLPEPIHGKFGRGCRWKSRLRLKIAVVDGALKIGCYRLDSTHTLIDPAPIGFFSSIIPSYFFFFFFFWGTLFLKKLYLKNFNI